MSTARAFIGLAFVILMIVVVTVNVNNIYQAHLKVVESEQELKEAKIAANQAMADLDQSIRDLNEMNNS